MSNIYWFQTDWVKGYVTETADPQLENKCPMKYIAFVRVLGDEGYVLGKALKTESLAPVILAPLNSNG